MFSKKEIQDYDEVFTNNDKEQGEEIVRDAFHAAYPDTKVVDEDGMPLKVKHGTNHYGFTVFDDNKSSGDIYFTNADNTADYYYDEGIGGKYNVYLNIENPFVYDAAGRNFGDLLCLLLQRY